MTLEERTGIPTWCRPAEIPSIVAGGVGAGALVLFGLPYPIAIFGGLGIGCLAILVVLGVMVVTGRVASSPRGPAPLEEIERRVSLLEDRVRVVETGLRDLELDGKGASP